MRRRDFLKPATAPVIAPAVVRAAGGASGSAAASPRHQLAAALAGFDLDNASAIQQLALDAGVTPRQIMRARKRRPVIASAFIRLCLIADCDPAPDLRLSAPALPADFDHVMLGMGFKVRRGANEHSVRKAAKAAGISSAAISRLENGHAMSVETILSACRYLGAHPFGYVKPQFHVEHAL